jgi:hypothetical protein
MSQIVNVNPEVTRTSVAPLRRAGVRPDVTWGPHNVRNGLDSVQSALGRARA